MAKNGNHKNKKSASVKFLDCHLLEPTDHTRKLVDSESKSISLELSDKGRLYDQLTSNSNT